jgi:hypothetical protein
LPIAARSKPVYLPSAVAHLYFTIAGGVKELVELQMQVAEI